MTEFLENQYKILKTEKTSESYLEIQRNARVKQN